MVMMEQNSFSVTPSGHFAIYGTNHFGGGSISHLFVGLSNPKKKIATTIITILNLLVEDDQ